MARKVVSVVHNCEQCPFSKTEQVYTGDSFDNIRSVYCSKLGKKVRNYLDWNEEAIIPSHCPLPVADDGEPND